MRDGCRRWACARSVPHRSQVHRLRTRITELIDELGSWTILNIMPVNGRHALRWTLALAGAAVLTALSVALPASAQDKAAPPESLPTVVLVHGAFAFFFNDTATTE